MKTLGANEWGKSVFRMDRIEQEVFGEEADELSSY